MIYEKKRNILRSICTIFTIFALKLQLSLMKHYIFSILAVITLLSSCGNSTPSTTPVHPAEPSIVPTTDDEMRNLVTAMTASNEWDKIMSKDFLSIMDEARHMTLGNRDNLAYDSFDWTCHTQNDDYTHAIDSIHIGTDSVNVDMTYTDASHQIAYTLVMKHERGKWCIDDVKWAGKDAPADTERHMAQAAIDDAANYLTSCDANFIVESRILPLAREAGTAQAPELAKSIETVRNYLKQNRGYTPEHEQQIANVVQQLKKE